VAINVKNAQDHNKNGPVNLLHGLCFSFTKYLVYTVKGWLSFKIYQVKATVYLSFRVFYPFSIIFHRHFDSRSIRTKFAPMRKWIPIDCSDKEVMLSRLIHLTGAYEHAIVLTDQMEGQTASYQRLQSLELLAGFGALCQIDGAFSELSKEVAKNDWHLGFSATT
jgi:hypothetical protein